MERAEYEKIQRRALKITHKAIRKGQLADLKQVNITCVDCDFRRAEVYNHRDYNKPLDVTPVCRSCNQKRGPVDSVSMLTKEQLADLRSRRYYDENGAHYL